MAAEDVLQTVDMCVSRLAEVLPFEKLDIGPRVEGDDGAAFEVFPVGRAVFGTIVVVGYEDAVARVVDFAIEAAAGLDMGETKLVEGWNGAGEGERDTSR